MLLQGAQVRRVGRADIYGDVIGDVIHRFKAGKVIRNRIGDRHAARLADVHADDAVGPVPAQTLCDWFSADEALSNAPHKANQLFVVTKVVE